jgi:hypothetical protein
VNQQALDANVLVSWLLTFAGSHPLRRPSLRGPGCASRCLLVSWVVRMRALGPHGCLEAEVRGSRVL